MRAGTSRESMQFGCCSPIVSRLKLHTLEEADVLIQKSAQESEVCRRMDAIPGIGPLTATALIAAIGNGAAFRKRREFAAEELFLGLLSRTLYASLTFYEKSYVVVAFAAYLVLMLVTL
jgi:transposase IS116/IS110/IS902 family protein